MYRHYEKRHPNNDEWESSLNLYEEVKNISDSATTQQLEKKLVDTINDLEGFSEMLKKEEPEYRKNNKKEINYYMDYKIPKQYGDIREEYDRQFPKMKSKRIVKPNIRATVKSNKYEKEFPALGANTGKSALGSKESSTNSMLNRMEEQKELPSVESIANDFASLALNKTVEKISNPVSNQHKKTARKKKKRESYFYYNILATD